MTKEELAKAYELSAQPYRDCPGPMTAGLLGKRSWRYVFEVNSACNLRCSLCHAGNRKGYSYTPGVMDSGLMNACLDKMCAENPGATVCCYVNSEPFLHPQLDVVVAHIKRRGLRCEIATNGNIIVNLEKVLAQKPDQLTVSVSGWTQPVYERAHRGGEIEKVKANIIEIAKARDRGNHFDILCGVSYHMYRDNTAPEEMNEMKKFTESLGLMFLLSYGRAICIENTVQALRQLEKERTGRDVPYEPGPDGQDMNLVLPAANAEFIKSMERLQFHPYNAMKFYERWPASPVCLVSEIFTEIRWDGRVQLCAWTDDMRLTLGNYLEMSNAQIAEKRLGHPLCRECLRYRLNYYFHIVDPNNFHNGGNIT